MDGKTHVLVIPFPVQGHINPMLQFSKRLASRAIMVTFLTAVEIDKSMQVHSGSVKVQFISSGLEHVQEAESFEAYLDRLRSVVSQSLAQLVHQLNYSKSEHPPKVLVYDSVMPWALEIAQKLGLKGASFFSQSCAVSAIYYSAYEGKLKIPVQGNQVSMPSLPILKSNDLPSFIADVDSQKVPLRLVLDQFSNFRRADWLLFNTFQKLEEEIVEWMEGQLPIRTIGPTIPLMYLDKRMEDDKDYGLNLFKFSTEACMKWLDTKENSSVVYTSFGSIASLNKVQMEELAWGLKNCNSHFLWVVRESEEGKLPENFIEEISEKALIINWSPQLDVLAHKAVGCFLSHCGWNSTLEALSMGVPMVAMPQLSDQTTNAKFIEDVWKVGVRLESNDEGIITREEIEVCIREVMGGVKGNELKKNASKWKKLAREAVDGGGSSDKCIDNFVTELTSM